MPTQEKKLIVAIPTYNRREYLHEAIESLDNQTYKNFQVIIFDNASDYDVNEFISIFPKLDIKIEKNVKNIGGVANFIKIVNYDFQSSYVIMFHDDDTLHPKYFEYAINFLDERPNLAWVGTNINFVKNKTKMSKFNVKTSDDSFLELGQQELIKQVMGGFNIGFGTIIYQSKILKEAQLRSDVFEKWADRPLFIDLALNRQVAVSKEKFMNYRMHEKKDSLIREPSNLGYLINLFNYYKRISNERDTYKFKVFETTNSINTATQIATTFKELLDTLGRLKKAELFSLQYISPKGVYYFIKFAIKKLI